MFKGIDSMGASSWNDGFLSSGQAHALAAIRENAARCSRAALPQLRARVSALGYTELDLAGALMAALKAAIVSHSPFKCSFHKLFPNALQSLDALAVQSCWSTCASGARF